MQPCVQLLPPVVLARTTSGTAMLTLGASAALVTYMGSCAAAETVRESDIEKLSFAVELADAFFGDSQVPPLPALIQQAVVRAPAHYLCVLAACP